MPNRAKQARTRTANRGFLICPDADGPLQEFLRGSGYVHSDRAVRASIRRLAFPGIAAGGVGGGVGVRGASSSRTTRTIKAYSGRECKRIAVAHARRGSMSSV